MTKNNEMKIDLSKLTIEELENIRFLNPTLVEIEMNSRKSFKSPQEMVEEATKVLITLRPFFENMKSCETKKTVYNAGLFEFLDKVINTGNSIETIDEEKAEKLGIDVEATLAEASQGTMADAVVETVINDWQDNQVHEEPTFEQPTPAQVTETIVKEETVAAPGAPAAPAAAPAVGGLDVSAIMAKAAALAAANK